MPVTREQAHQLAELAADMRPFGAKHWDTAGIIAAIGKVAHLALADVAMATIRAASDRTADNPGVISATTSLHWREKVAERTTPSSPRRGEECLTCGRHITSCICGEQRRRPEHAASDQTRDQTLAAMRAQVAGIQHAAQAQEDTK